MLNREQRLEHYRKNPEVSVLIETLFSRYGTRAEEIAEFMSQSDDRQLVSYPTYSTNETAHIVHQEGVVHLDDFLLRRSMIGMLGRITTDGLNELATVIGSIKGWEEGRMQYEIQRTVNILQSKHLMDFTRYIGDSRR
jgi:glycerol-3-phosphate dehydrogenase